MTTFGTWSGNWAWGLPLIVFTVVTHVCGLGLIYERVVDLMSNAVKRQDFLLRFAAVMSVAALLVTLLHGLEGTIWGAAYLYLGGMPDVRVAMLFSLSAMTTYGNSNVSLPVHWQLMGALEALNGMLLFGLTTAFLFAMIQGVWPLGVRQRR